MFDKFKDECGVFGIFGHPEAANMTYLGLYALQHRGQESAGIAASDGTQVRVSRAMGYVADAFDGTALAQLPGVRQVAPQDRTADGRVALTLTADRTRDLRPEIFALAKARGWTLYELHQAAGSLEDLFQQLTQGAAEQ